MLSLDAEDYEALGYGRQWLAQLFASFEEREQTLAVKREYMRATKPRKRSESAPCKGCGKPFTNRKNGWLRSYCTDQCRISFNNRAAREKNKLRMRERRKRGQR